MPLNMGFQLMQSQPIRLTGLVLGMALGFGGMLLQPAQAQESQGTEALVLQQLEGLDLAASQEDLAGVLQYYDADFWHTDGLTRSMLGELLEDFWGRYSDLSYSTELLSIETTPEGLVAETQTQIQGTEVLNNRELSLESTLRTRQHWEGNLMVRQEVLAESNRVRTGANPPALTVALPEQVEVNSPFYFDVIVEEPLGDDLLLGGVLDEPVRQNQVFNPTEIEVQPLTAGGLFKLGRAPAVRDDRWVSAVVIRKGGVTFFTQRLRIVDRDSGS